MGETPQPAVSGGARLNHAAHAIHAGQVIACASEYCFGLGCDPMNRAVVMRLLRLKRRSWTKGLILIAADVAQLSPYVTDLPAHTAASWPGPYTWLLTPRPGVPRWITGRHARIAVRVTAHPQAAALCRAAGMAIISTSANRAGERPARSDREVRRRFGSALGYVLPGRVGDAPAPTPIRDAATGNLTRPG